MRTFRRPIWVEWTELAGVKVGFNIGLHLVVKYLRGSRKTFQEGKKRLKSLEREKIRVIIEIYVKSLIPVVNFVETSREECAYV